MFASIEKLTPEYLKGIITYWDWLILFLLGNVLLVIPLGFTLPHMPVPSEMWFDILLTPLFFWDFLKAKKENPHETKGYLNITLQVLSIFPFQSLIQVSGVEFLWMPLFQGIRLLRGPLLIERMTARSEGQLIKNSVKLVFGTFVGMIIVHWVTCGWILVNNVADGDPVTLYNKSLYWAITTLTTVGYGDITPSNNGARIYTMIVMVLGVGFYGLVIGQVSRMMMESDKRKEGNREKLQNLTSLFRYYEIPAQLQDEVFQFYQHLLTRKMSEDEAKVLKELPNALQSELQIYMNMKPLSNIALFKNVSLECLKDIAMCLEQEFFTPSSHVITKGDIGNEMFLIGHGVVEVIINEDKISLTEGDCFGEMALIGNAKRGADVVAKTYCDLFVLRKDKFDTLLSKHSGLKKNVHELISKR